MWGGILGWDDRRVPQGMWGAGQREGSLSLVFRCSARSKFEGLGLEEQREWIKLASPSAFLARPVSQLHFSRQF